MMSVQIAGEWIQTDDKSLVEMVLDGRVEELTPARDAAKSLAACPLIELLQPPHLEALTHRLAQRLPGLYVTGPESTDLASLLDRIKRLCAWNWADHLVKGRLVWLEGWLSELSESFERAIKSYDAYLRGLSQEPVLRLLAYNNRGVLRIHLRQAEGIKDIARAAIGDDDGQDATADCARLPAACFNLLNLLTHALNRHPLCDQAEDALVDFMLELPKRARERCLGPDPSNPQATNEASLRSWGRNQTVSAEMAYPDQGSPVPGNPPDANRGDGGKAREWLRARFKILTDPTFVRLTRLVVYLADVAPAISPDPEGRCTLEAVTAQLQLWPVEPAGDAARARQLVRTLAGQPRAQNPFDRCAEAASLLYTSDIPSSLVPGDGSISWVRQYTDKAMGLVEEYCADGDYRLAESTLESLSDALKKYRDDPLVEAIKGEVAQRMVEVRHRAQAHEQLDLYQTCTDLVRQVKELCSRTDLCQAEFDAEVLLRRVKQAQERLAKTDVSDGNAAPLLSDLPDRIEKHLDRLRRKDVEERIGKAKERLYATCPQDWREPVPRETYEALRKCQANDPTGLVDDWRAWRARLDKHQARYHFRQALADATEGKATEADIEQTLARALGFDPGLTPASAPLYCMLALRDLDNPPEDLARTKADILNTARTLLQMEPLGPDALWSPALRTGLVQEACVLLERLIQAYHGVGAELDELWQALERGFAPAFAEAPPQVLREVQTVVQTCLKACPVHVGGARSSIDPRNRLHILQQTCRKAILVAEGEEALHEASPRDARERFKEGIEALALERPISDRDVPLLRRAACGLYLATFAQQDPVHVQRRILNEIDGWIERIQEGGRDADCRVQRVEAFLAEKREPTGSDRQ